MSLEKRKLDVLIISGAYPPDPGGVATHVYYLAYALSKLTKSRVSTRRVCNVHVLTGGKSRRAEAEGTRPFLTVHRVPGENRHFLSVGDVPLEEPTRFLFDHWGRIRPDVVHAHDFESAQIGLMLKTAFGVPLIITVHKVPKEWDQTLPRRDPKDCFLQVMLDFEIPDMLVASSRAYQQRLFDQGFPEEKIAPIPHGVPVNWLSSWPNKDAVLQRFNLQEDHELILCPTRLDPHKGPETVVDAAAILKDRLLNRNLVFVIAGAGSSKYRTELQQQARDRSVETAMRFGPSDEKDVSHDEMPTLYRRATLCVVPSRREGFGQVLLEAFVFRKPVVAANTGGIPDIVEPGVTGLLFNRDEPEDLASQIQRLLEDRNLAELLAAQAYNKLRREYDAQRMAQSYFRLYQRVSKVTVK